MFGKFIDSSTVTGTQIRLDNEQWLRGRNFANSGDLNILRINSSNQIEFKQIPYVEGQGRLALYSELDGILTSVEYLYGQLSEVTGNIATIQGDIVDIQAEIDALQEEVGDFALKDLSNLEDTSIPDNVNLRSVTTNVFTVGTYDKTSTTGAIDIASGNSTVSGNTGTATLSSGINLGTGNTGNVSVFSGSVFGPGNSGHVLISSGVSNISGNTGDVNISTGIPVSGNRGQIYLTSTFVKLQQYTRLVLEDNTGDRLVRLQLSNGSSDGDGQFFFNRIRSDKTIYIGAMESHVNDNGAPVYFSGTFILSSLDGQYKSSDVYLQSNSYANFQIATNVAISTGDVYIRSESSFVQGTETDANTGNITLQTGTPSGAGTKGYISLNADYITANSTQLKNLADGTDPQDAATVSQLGGISGSFALTDLSNLVSPTLIPDGVGLNSVSTTSFSISTSDSITTDPTGAIDINTGDINNVASSANTGIMGIRSGETNGSGNTGEVQIYSGNNNGTGSSGNIVISAGTTSDDDKTTGSIEIRSGFPFGNSNSGSINIFSHNAQKRTGDVSLHTGNSSSVGDSGNILIYSGNVTSGIRGSIDLNGQSTSVYLRNFDVTGYWSLFRITNSSPGSIGELQFLVDAKGNDTIGMRIFDSDPVSGFSIDGWGRDAQNGGPFSFQSTKAYPSDSVSTLTGGDFNILAQSTDNNNKGPYIPSRAAEISSGNVNIDTANAYISGSGANANTGNINLTTGNAQGTGTRGYISLNGDYITANSSQIKNLADGTDPQDAVTVSQLGGISGSYALTDLSNLAGPTAIPDGVGLTSLTVPTIPNPLAAFEIKTSDQVGANGSGGVKLYSGNIFSPVSTQNTGIASLSSGLTLGSGNTGAVNIATGDNVGSGNSGDVNISTGASVSGTRGSIFLDGEQIISRVNWGGGFKVTTTGALSEVMIHNRGFAIQNSPEILFNGIPQTSVAVIQAFSLNNNNGAPFYLASTIINASADGTYTGGDLNISASGQGPAVPTNYSINSGTLRLSTANGAVGGSFSDANSGNVEIFTGTAQGTGTRGSVLLDGKVVSADVDVFFKVSTPGSANEVWIGNTSYTQLGGPFIYASALATNRTFEIGGQGVMNLTPGTTELHGAAIISDTDGNYASGKLELRTKVETGTNADNASYSSGDIEIYTGDGTVYGTGFPDANSGNVIIRTGNKEGSGTRGTISLSASYINTNLAQIKNVADPTDPQDALTLNYFNNNIPNVAALDYYPLQAYNTYAPIYADATAGVLDPVTPTNPRPGWYFKNSAGSPQKINWYFFDGTIVSCQLQNFSAFAVVTLDSIASLPYFIFYTFPTGSGDIIPTFAHSQVVYSAPYVPSAVAGTKYLIYFGEEPDVFPYLPRIELTYNAAASGGDQGATELVSTCAFSTESGASANNVQVMVENLGLNISTFKAYFNLLIFPVFEESQDYYGSFYSTQDQDNLVPDIARAMTFNNTDEANGVSIVSSSQITFATGGLYNVQFSAQFTHSNSSSQDVDIWLAKNGVNVPYTNSRETLAGQVSVISAWNFFVRVNSGDYVEIYWSSPSDDVVIEYTGAQTVPTRPETPSIILTVNKIIS